MARGEVSIEPEEVVKHLDLTIAVRTGANSNRGNRQTAGNLSSNARRHELQHDRKDTGLLQGAGVGQQGEGIGRLARLDSRAARGLSLRTL